MEWLLWTLPGLFIWSLVLCLPWHPWSTCEFLEAVADDCRKLDLSQITVLIPARNEAEVIAETLVALKLQDESLKIVLIDDQSDDDASGIVRKTGLGNLKIIAGQPLPDGWSGKLWTLEQGLRGNNDNTVPDTLHRMQSELNIKTHILYSQSHM